MTERKDAFTVGRPHSRMRSSYSNVFEYREGVIVTANGYVEAYSQDGLSRLSFIWRGKEYHWTWDRQYSDRFLTTLAKDMVACITGGGS